MVRTFSKTDSLQSASSGLTRASSLNSHFTDVAPDDHDVKPITTNRKAALVRVASGRASEWTSDVRASGSQSQLFRKGSHQASRIRIAGSRTGSSLGGEDMGSIYSGDEDETAHPVDFQPTSSWTAARGFFKSVFGARSTGRPTESQSHHHGLHMHQRGHHEHDEVRQLAAGEEAFLTYSRLAKTAGGNQMVGQQMGGKRLVPIAKRYDKVQSEMDDERVRIAEEAAQQSKSSIPAKSLHEWYNAGLSLRKDVSEDTKQPGDLRPNRSNRPVIEGARPLPEGYEIVDWSSLRSPLLRHVSTGTIIWPVRFDLVPLYDYVEGRTGDDFEGVRATTTVFHYTSAGGFSALVSPPQEKYRESWEFAEELWDRLECDFERHGLPDVEDSPEFSLSLVASEPAKFLSRQDVAKAVYHTNQPNAGSGKWGHMLAFRAPTDHCLAAAAENDEGDAYLEHTVIVLAPGKDDDEVLSDEGGTVPRSRFRQWSTRQMAMVNSRRQSLVGSDPAGNVRKLDLLKGLIDRDTGEVTLQSADIRYGSKERFGSKDSRNSNPKCARGLQVRHESHEHEEEEEELRRLIGQLGDAKIEFEKKIKHAEKHSDGLKRGVKCDLLAADSHRLEKLRDKLSRVVVKLESAQSKIKELLGEDDVYEENASAVRLSRAERQKQLRRSKRQARTDGSEFMHEVKAEVKEYGHEYGDMEGDIFREVFGGAIKTIERWLASGGNINGYHQPTGWTPLLMATSQGDPALVAYLFDKFADPSRTSKDFGLSPAHLAVRKNSMDLIRLVLEKHPSSVHEQSHDGTSVLLAAVDTSPPKVRNDMVRMLLEAASDPNNANKDGWTPLGMAVVRKYQQAIKLLIQHRGSIFDNCPGTNPLITVWQAASMHPGLQYTIKNKLNSRDLHMIERRWPGQIGKIDNDRKKAIIKLEEAQEQTTSTI